MTLTRGCDGHLCSNQTSSGGARNTIFECAGLAAEAVRLRQKINMTMSKIK